MTCTSCDGELTVTRKYDIKLNPTSQTLGGDIFAGDGIVTEYVVLKCDCTEIEADRKGYTIPNVPAEWLNIEEPE